GGGAPDGGGRPGLRADRVPAGLARLSRDDHVRRGRRAHKHGVGPTGQARLEPRGRDETGYLRPRPLDPVRARVPARDLVTEGDEIPGMAHADRAGADHKETHQRSLSARTTVAT